MYLTLPDLREGYVRVCQEVLLYGDTVDVRDLRTKEVIGVTLEFPWIKMPMLPVGVNRGVNMKLAAVETLGTVGGVWPHDLVLAASPRYGDVLIDASAEYSTSVAYGPRIKEQLHEVLRQLRADPTTRQAILSIWQVHDLVRVNDKPCTLTLQYLLRDRKLHCIGTMRSQDVWLGLAMDVFVFTQLQLTLARMLRVEPGQYVHHVGSMHAYERDWDRIADLSAPGKMGVHPLGLLDVADARRILAGERIHGDEWYCDKVAMLRERAMT